MDIKKTITSIFMVPTLKIGRDNLINNEFINGYIRDVNKDVQYENAVYLLFKPNNFDKFRAFLSEEYLKANTSIIDDYDYSGGYVVVVYELDAKYKKDIKLIKLGKYSKTSKEFQELFPKTVKIAKGGSFKEETSLQFRVFNKTEDIIKFWEDKLDVVFDSEQEVWYGFVEENEILDIDKIKQYVEQSNLSKAD